MSMMVTELNSTPGGGGTGTSPTNSNSIYSQQHSTFPESTQFYLSETPSERDDRIRELFNTLDRENRGLLDSKAIQRGFTAMTHLPARTKYANELLSRCDTSHDGLVDFEEFKTYVNDKENELWQLFKKLDRSGGGQLDPTDLQMALRRAGMEICEEDVVEFMQLMDADGNGLIDFNEFKNFLLLLPQTNMSEMYRYYESSTQLTQDGEVVIPTTDETARNALGYLLAGGIAGAVSRTCTAPFDRLKVYLITHSSTPQNPLTLATAVRSIYSHGGWKSFFVGNGLNVMKIIPESAIKFYSYESCKQLIANILHCEDKDSIPTSARFAAGGMAGICAQFSIYPVETLKTRIMTHQSCGGNTTTTITPASKMASRNTGSLAKATYSSLAATSSPSSSSASSTGNRYATAKNSIITETAKSMYAKGGIKAFWPGLTLGLIGVFPYQAMDLGIYETLKLSYLQYSQGEYNEDGSQKQPNVFVLWACGMISGTIGATSVYPLNVIRTRLQAQGTKGHPRVYKSPWEAVQITFLEGGVKGFYKGLGPTLLKVVPAVSLSYVTYEWSKRELGLS
ncbi:calcium-binding mitochondrial carrier protein SCaMC-1-like isoform X3 [Mucor ambiguus]|uniref:Calcium-binding mitochondrial carrier protein SCaMC-1-like isoform X3 n=1 Tax=Mucor ambiguus TaxID=91626 RepID=A0A0C9MKW0_9FUNG|nr:calcium-binding mitochondrial carrier protein SCaMC-1-like isoform X3 [Mucor ambiguus]